MAFPVTRLRRLRKNPVIRNLVRETVLTRNDLIMPMFVTFGKNRKNPISSMPGNYQLSVDLLTEECKKLYDRGVQALLLFGIPEHKDEQGSEAYDPNGIVQKAIRAIKKEINDILVITDEMDKLIELKALRISHWIFTLGFFLSMILLATGARLPVYFLVLIVSGFISSLAADMARIIYYRKGV